MNPGVLAGAAIIRTPAFSATQRESEFVEKAKAKRPTILVLGLSCTILAAQSFAKAGGTGFGTLGF